MNGRQDSAIKTLTITAAKSRHRCRVETSGAGPEILTSVGEALYRWDIDSDALTWSANAADVLSIRRRCGTRQRPRLSRSCSRPTPRRPGSTRYAIRASATTAAACAYRIQYGIRPEPGCGHRPLGRGHRPLVCRPDGKPARAHGVLRVINERYEHERRLNFLARYDGLTGEFNRHHLTEILEDTLEEAIRFRSSCGFLLVAIDNLARINESYGFDTADQVIGAVAKRIRSRMRGKDTLGRFSGNKFGVVLRDCTPDDMAIAAERMLAGVRDEMVPTAAGPIAVTVTIGGVTAPRHARSVAEVLARAQEALDAAKASATARSAPTGPISSARRCAATTYAPPTRSSPRSTSAASFSPTRRVAQAVGPASPLSTNA